jgi:hypothetical protein
MVNRKNQPDSSTFVRRAKHAIRFSKNYNDTRKTVPKPLAPPKDVVP